MDITLHTSTLQFTESLQFDRFHGLHDDFVPFSPPSRLGWRVVHISRAYKRDLVFCSCFGKRFYISVMAPGSPGSRFRFLGPAWFVPSQTQDSGRTHTFQLHQFRLGASHSTFLTLRRDRAELQSASQKWLCWCSRVGCAVFLFFFLLRFPGFA